MKSTPQSHEKNDRPYVLLTGGTGLVGQYLLKDFLASNTLLAVLVRPGKKLDARERIEAAMQRWEKKLDRHLPRPVILVGNINEPMLGPSDHDQCWVCLLYTSPSPRDATLSRMPSSA